MGRRRPAARSLAGAVALALLAAACAHPEPFDPGARDPLGPPDPDLPRRLTFNPGDDRAPSVAGGQVAYSRYDEGNDSSGTCIALLPVEGGTLTATYCPPPPTPADTFIHSWLEPALSPDGGQLAYVWRRSGPVSLTAWSYHLIVADVDSPAVPRFSRQLGGPLSGGRFYRLATEIAWIAPDRLRFLGTWDSVFRIDPPLPGRLTDTVLIPRALMELNLTTGELGIVPGGDVVSAWTQTAAGTFIVAGGVFRLGADGSRTPVGGLDGSDLAAAGSGFVAVTGGELLFSMTLPDGAIRAIPLPGNSRRLVGGTANLVVVEVDRAGDAYGGPANLWLVPIPVP